jgi:hypothetical protein
MRASEPPKAVTPLGHGLIHVRLTDALKSLYTGPFHPRDLKRVEHVLRAFLLSERMSVLRVSWLFTTDHDDDNPDDGRVVSPFDGEALDYEFEYPETLPKRTQLTAADTSFIIDQVRKLATDDLIKSFPPTLSRNNERYVFLRAWYEGKATEEALAEASLIRTWNEGKATDEDLAKAGLYDIVHLGNRDNLLFMPFLNDNFNDFTKNEPLNRSIEWDSNYLLECYRSRYSIYGDGPIFYALDSEAATSKLPLEMFRDLDERFLQAARLARQPGLAVDMPILLTLVLSRARTRNQIVDRIIELREQYGKARRDMWAHIEAIWDAPFPKAIRLYEDFQRASANIFEAAFPHRKRVMGIGFNAAASYVAPSSGVNAAKEIAEMFTAQWRVNAMSFAKQLSDDLHRELGNQAEVLRRHLTKAELRHFGLA